MELKTNKAFTLIELLAVIVILAIIALIATPIILGIVEDARKDSFERSVELLISTTDLDVAGKNIQEGYTYEIIDGTIPDLEIGIKNIDGMNGTIIYDKEGKEQYAIYNGKYCVMKTEGMDKAVISEYEEGSCKLSIVTSSKYFTYREIIEPTYKITDKQKCVDVYVNEWKMSEERAISDCNNDPIEDFDGMTLTEALASGLLGITDTKILLDAGAISYTGPEYEIIDKEACINFEMNVWEMSEEQAISDCNNEPIEELDGMTLTEALAFGSIPQEMVTQFIEAGAIRVKNAPLEITGYSSEGPKDVVIPNTIDGNTVVSIGPNAFSGKNLTSVILPETITHIKFGAFIGNQITNIKLPNNIESLENNIFCYNDLNEESINNIVAINNKAYCTPTSENCFTYEDVSGGISITGYKCAETDVVIPSIINNKNVVKIGEIAFEAYQYQSEVSYLNDRTVRPVNYEFAATLPRGILTSIILPDTVIYIDNYAFPYNRITNIYLSKNLEYIGDSAFSNNQITTLTIPDSVKHIGLGAFANNQITTIELSNNNHLETVEDFAFCNSSVLVTSQAYQTIYQINPYVFGSCR